MAVTAETIKEAALSRSVREAPDLTMEQAQHVAVLLGLKPGGPWRSA